MKRIFILFIANIICSVLFAQNSLYYTPPAGSKERAQILNTIRPVAIKFLHQKVTFLVCSMAVNNKHAVAFVIPQDQKGKLIDGKEQWIFALLEKNESHWKLLESSFSEDGNELDQWKNKYPEVAPILFDAVGVATNADDVP